MPKYWIKSGDTPEGPFTGKQIRELAKQGRLNRQHQISSDSVRWVVAESIPGLEFKDEEPPIDGFVGVNEEVDDEYQLAPESHRSPQSSRFGQDEIAPTARPNMREAAVQCPKCNGSLRLLRKSKSLTGKTLCVECDMTPGVCPACSKPLASKESQQCLGCGVSWHVGSLQAEKDGQPTQAARIRSRLSTGGPAECHRCRHTKASNEIYVCPGCSKFVCQACLHDKTPDWWEGLSGSCPGCWERCKSDQLLSSLEREQSEKLAKNLSVRDHLVNLAEQLVNMAVQIVVGLVGICVAVAVVTVIAHVLEGENAPEQVVIGNWHDEAWTAYSDPKGRFTCEVPPNWRPDELSIGPQSELRLVRGDHSIAVTVRETSVHEMYEGIQQEMVEGMKKTAARAFGSDGEVSEDAWTTLAGSRALRIDLNSERRSRFARTIKAKHGGFDHLVAIYVDPSSQKDELCALFDEFLKRYDQGKKPPQ